MAPPEKQVFPEALQSISTVEEKVKKSDSGEFEIETQIMSFREMRDLEKGTKGAITQNVVNCAFAVFCLDTRGWFSYTHSTNYSLDKV